MHNKSVIKDNSWEDTHCLAFSAKILEALFGDEWGEMSSSSVGLCTGGMVHSQQQSLTTVQVLLRYYMQNHDHYMITVNHMEFLCNFKK